MWTRSTRKGYGQIWFEGNRECAHRVSWVMANGPIPDGLFVCHTCDNPPCVRPDHLFLGTVKDNGVDMAKKDRGRHQNPNFQAWQASRRAEAERLTAERGKPHGTTYGYERGCRDACCRQAIADYQRERMRSRRQLNEEAA